VIRTLDAPNDRRAFEQVWAWVMNYPRWLQEADALDRPDFTGFYEVACRPTTLNFGLYADDKLAALIQFTQEAPDVFEVHFDGNREAAPELLADALFSLGWELFEKGAERIFAWIVTRNTGSMRVCQSCQMHWDGARLLRGAWDDQPIEWLRMSFPRAQWERIKDGRQ